MSRLWVRLAAAAAILLGLFLAGRALGGRVPEFADWVGRQGAWAPVVFVLGYAAAAVALVPGSILTLAGGAIFGLWRGVIFVFLGALLGSSAAFLIARYLLRGMVARRVERDSRFKAVDEAVARDGRRIVLLLRLSPVFPFSLLNYALGLTKVRFVDYFVASIGMLPGTLLYVYYGKLAGDVAGLAGGGTVRHGASYWIVLGLGLVATVIVTILVTRAAKNALATATGVKP